MKKKILIPAIASVLMLVLLSAGPVFAGGPPHEFESKEWDRVTLYPGEIRITPNGDTSHQRGTIREGKFSSPQLGTGYVTRTVDCDTNLKTLIGTCRGEAVITIEEPFVGTLSGSWVCLNDYTDIPWTGICKNTATHGTGAFEGYKAFFECIVDHTAGTAQCEGKIIYP